MNAIQERRLDEPKLRLVLSLGLFGIAYYFAFQFGMSFSQTSASPFWFPDSILLCALLANRPSRWWIFLLVAMAIRLFSPAAEGNPTWFLLATYFNDAAKSLFTAAVLRRFVRNPLRFETIREFGLFCLVAALLSPALSAFGGAWARQRMGADYWPAWEQWFLGDVLTQLVVTPAILCWVFGTPWKMPAPSTRRCLEGSALAAGLILTGWMAFITPSTASSFADAGYYAPIPLMFWAAMRFGMLGTSGAIVVITCFAVEAALHGRGHFSGLSPSETAAALQNFLLVRAAPLYLVAIVIDQKNATERSLRESEERYREVVESQTDLVCRYLHDTTLSFVNDAYCRHFKRRRDDLIGLKFIDLIPPASIEKVRSMIDALGRDRRAITVEHEVNLPDGTVGWQQWTNYPIVGPDGEPIEYQAIGRDITDRKRSEEANRSLAHASRLAVAGELTAMIAHEINQPLGAIQSNTDAAEILLESPYPPLDEVRQILTDIRKDNERASEAIYRIRTLLQKRDPERQPVVLNEVVSEALQFVNGDAVLRRVEIHTELASKLPVIQADKVQLQQVMLNLVLNSMEAVAELPPAKRRISIRTAGDDNGHVEVIVADSGPGIAPDKLPRVFESFFTTKKGGMGLGLSIAQSIIQKHNGRIRAENGSDGGAILRFTLPVSGEG